MPRVSALILCGGGGTRLGGIDKPLRDFCGEPLIMRVLQVVELLGAEIIISANRNQDLYAKYARVVADESQFQQCGPLAGLLAGLDAAACDHLLCVPGDAPLLPRNLLGSLWTARAQMPASNLAYAHDGRGPQPLCCLVPRALRDDLRNYLGGGGRTPREWFQRHHAVEADFHDSPPWAWSLNTQQEWTMAEQQYSVFAST